jgi:hypothetical protein
MSINYYLRKSNLKGNKGGYTAGVLSNIKVEYDELIDKMIERGLTVNRGDIIRVLGHFQEMLEILLSEGAIVRTPFANFSSSICGSFDGLDDSFHPERHKLIPIINPGIRLRKFYKYNIETIKHEKSEIRPELTEYTDYDSGECHSKITPGGLTTIKGHNLSYNSENNEDGIYYIAEDGSELKVEIIARNNPSYLQLKHQNLLIQDPTRLR